MNQYRYNAVRAISGIAILALMGAFGCFAGGHELENLFLEGNPFPLVYLNILGIATEIAGLATLFMMARVRPGDWHIRHPAAARNVTYVFGGIAISILLLVFYIGYNNFFSMGGGQVNYNYGWGYVIILSYIGIMAQIYTMYKAQKSGGDPPEPPTAPDQT